VIPDPWIGILVTRRLRVGRCAILSALEPKINSRTFHPHEQHVVCDPSGATSGETRAWPRDLGLGIGSDSVCRVAVAMGKRGRPARSLPISKSHFRRNVPELADPCAVNGLSIGVVYGGRMITASYPKSNRRIFDAIGQAATGMWRGRRWCR